jgi:heme exporter protein D
MDEQAWVERTAGQLAVTLADPSVRAQLLTLLAGTKDERERQRRLEAARRELAAMEVTWPLLEEEPGGP